MDGNVPTLPTTDHSRISCVGTRIYRNAVSVVLVLECIAINRVVLQGHLNHQEKDMSSPQITKLSSKVGFTVGC